MRPAIFLDDEDKGLFLGILPECASQFGWLCHMYCLMDNHYHLLIEPPERDLSAVGRQLNINSIPEEGARMALRLEQ
jgi:REP element-mobilizing transposase RayT